MSEEQTGILGVFSIIDKDTIFGQYMAMLRNFEGRVQADYARDMGFSRACLSKFETGEKSHEKGFYRLLRKNYLSALKLNEEFILKLFKDSSSLFRAFRRYFKRYSSIFYIASRKVRCRDSRLVKECRKCMLDVLAYLLVRGFFKVFALKPCHIGMVFANNIKEYKYRRATGKKMKFEESFRAAVQKNPTLKIFSSERIWYYFNNKRTLCCKKLEETMKYIHRIGLV